MTVSTLATEIVEVFRLANAPCVSAWGSAVKFDCDSRFQGAIVACARVRLRLSRASSRVKNGQH